LLQSIAGTRSQVSTAAAQSAVSAVMGKALQILRLPTYTQQQGSCRPLHHPGEDSTVCKPPLKRLRFGSFRTRASDNSRTQQVMGCADALPELLLSQDAATHTTQVSNERLQSLLTRHNILGSTYANRQACVANLTYAEPQHLSGSDTHGTGQDSSGRTDLASCCTFV